MNIKALKKVMLDHMDGDSFNYELAAVLGVSYSTAANRMSGRSEFKPAEKKVLTNHYHMTEQRQKEVFGSVAQ